MPLTVPEGWSKPRAFYDANKIDFHLCGIMFWFMGGRVSDCIVGGFFFFFFLVPGNFGVS